MRIKIKRTQCRRDGGQGPKANHDDFAPTVNRNQPDHARVAKWHLFRFAPLLQVVALLAKAFECLLTIDLTQNKLVQNDNDVDSNQGHSQQRPYGRNQVDQLCFDGSVSVVGEPVLVL